MLGSCRYTLVSPTTNSNVNGFPHKNKYTSISRKVRLIVKSLSSYSFGWTHKNLPFRPYSYTNIHMYAKYIFCKLVLGIFHLRSKTWCQITQQRLILNNYENHAEICKQHVLHMPINTSRSCVYFYWGLVVWVHMKLERHVQANVMRYAKFEVWMSIGVGLSSNSCFSATKSPTELKFGLLNCSANLYLDFHFHWVTSKTCLPSANQFSFQQHFMQFQTFHTCQTLWGILAELDMFIYGVFIVLCNWEALATEGKICWRCLDPDD